MQRFCKKLSLIDLYRVASQHGQTQVDFWISYVVDSSGKRLSLPDLTESLKTQWVSIQFNEEIFLYVAEATLHYPSDSGRGTEQQITQLLLAELT